MKRKSEKMNICILKESLTLGGTERSVANISQVLEKDHNVYLALYDAQRIQYTYGGEVVDFAAPPRKTILGKIWNTFYRNWKLKQLLKEKQIDILYTFTGIINRATLFAYPETVKLISARDFGLMRDRFAEYYQALNNSDAMICNSEYTKSFYLAKYPQHADRVFAVYNYINLDEINAQAQEAVEEGYLQFLENHSQTVVSVGRFCKEKGFEYLIESFALARTNNPQLGLVLVGDGDYLNRYQDIIGNSGVGEHIYLTGFQKNPYKYMAKCSCFVLSSLSEGFPNVLAEAMALGLPVIATNCRSGPAEILRKDCDYTAITDTYQECDYGMITPEMTDGDNENAIGQLAAAITALLANPEKMADYGKLAKLRAGDFSQEATAKQLEEIFLTLLGRKTS